MDAPSSSILFDASSAPPAQNEPLIQEDKQNDKTAEEKELEAAQLRIDALPVLKILSIMRKALPEDAHIDADVDEVIRSCVAKFTGVLTKEAKQQQTLARHKALESEDIINALKTLGFEDSSTTLSLFFSRFRATTNHAQPQQVQLPVHTSELIQTEMQQQGNINVPNQGSNYVQLPGNAIEPLATEMQQQGGVNIPTGITFGPNRGITHGDPTSSLQYWGNATMPPPPSPALPSWPASYVQPIPTQQTQQERTMWGASNPQITVNPDTMPADGILGTGAGNTSDSPLDQEMTDADIAFVLELLRN